MLKKVLTISPEFNEEFIRYQPWKQIHELGKRMSARGIEFVIATNATEKKEIGGLKIIIETRNEHEDSMKKFLEGYGYKIRYLAGEYYLAEKNLGNS